MRSLAWTKHLLFPELSTVADCTVEAVGCLDLLLGLELLPEGLRTSCEAQKPCGTLL